MPEDDAFPVETLQTRFLEIWRAQPGHEAVVDDAFRLTLDELMRYALALSKVLEQRAKSPVGHVGLLMPNCAPMVTGIFGILLAGKTIVPLNFLLPPPDLLFCIQDAEIDLLLSLSALREKLEPLKAASGGKIEIIYLDELLQQPGVAEAVAGTNPETQILALDADAEKTAALVYTSGTTGRPKGVMLSHKNLLSNISSCAELMRVTADDRFLSVLPLFHSFAILATTLLPVLKGATVILLKRFTVGSALKAIADERISVLMLTPSMWQLLSRAKEFASTPKDKLRLCISGGGPISAKSEAEISRLLGLPLLNGYGQTEASPVISVNVPWKLRAGSIGAALPGVEVRTVDDDGKSLGIGETGEIQARGDNVMKGYFKRPDETKKAITTDGWLCTGDFGYVDKDGFVFITGRKKELIIVGGENVHPREIEEVLDEHPAIAESAVIGIPDELRGEVPKAYYVLKEGYEVAPKELREFLLKHIPAFKVPREFERMDLLPKNALGKVLKHQLR